MLFCLHLMGCMFQIQFFVPLNGTINFSKCRKLYIRGYNQAGIWATTSTELKQCTAKEGLSLISPNIVLDAVGEQEYSLGKTLLKE